jgi:hypothetical protein
MRARLFILTAILAACAACTPQPRATGENKQTFDVDIKICWSEPATCNTSSSEDRDINDHDRNPP